jgi:type III restriction enzyme
MSITKLHGYQAEAVATIAEKFQNYLINPPLTGTEKNPVPIPFIYSLKSITGSGKTAMLAALTSQLSEDLYHPIVLWMSQSKVVVEQTLTNLSSGGKYNSLLGAKSEVYSIQELINGLTAPFLNSYSPLIYLTTTGVFNVQTKEGRLIYQTERTDHTSTSIWELLITRPLAEKKRGLIIIYDEGQHLTEQQINRLLELAPNALILASGTPSHSKRLVKEIQKANWKVEDLIFSISNNQVVATGLIKNKLRVIGYESPREEILNSLIVDWKKLNSLALQRGLKGLKVIYVCKTNILEKEKFEKDNSSLPFEQRKAPTILIWRHLVEHCRIEPKKVAVCANLEFKRDFPPPADFALFDGQSGQDYQKFLQGNYQHIIFNKSLLEGWDDNLVSFVYIDRNIGSDIQAQQLIGRALRTPQGKHYRGQYKDLNTAYFYIKTSNKEFSEIVSRINKELESISELIKIDVPTKAEKKKLSPVLVRKERYLPQIAVINQTETELAIRDILVNEAKDYSQVDPSEIEPEDKRAIMDYHIGKNTPLKVIWEKFSFSNKVSVRSVLRRSIMNSNSRALDLTDLNSLEHKEKLDFLIGRNSPAEKKLKEIAHKIVGTYLAVIQLITQHDEPLLVPDMNVNLSDCYEFNNSLHKYYSNLNPIEYDCARMIDELGYDWVRNPVFIGFGIPLLSQGFTKKFYPDFLIWIDDDTLVAVETTGKELLKDKLDRKLFSIKSFDLELVPVGQKIIPPRKVKVGVIVTTEIYGKYRVYWIGESGELVSSRIMEMEECIREILEF